MLNGAADGCCECARHWLNMTANRLRMTWREAKGARIVSGLLRDHTRGDRLDDFCPHCPWNDGSGIDETGLDGRRHHGAGRDCHDHVVFERNAADGRIARALDGHKGYGVRSEAAYGAEGAIEFRQVKRPFARRLDLPNSRRTPPGRKPVDLYGKTGGGTGKLVRAKLNVPVRGQWRPFCQTLHPLRKVDSLMLI